MGKVNIKRILDKWNPKKVWLIKHYKDGHYTVNQEVSGRVLYQQFQWMRKKQIASIFDVKER